MRAVPTLICWIGLLAGCASTLQPITPGGPSFESDDFRFVAPTGWQVRPSMDPRSAARGRLVVYVASQPLRDDCTRVGAELVCRSPLLEELSPGGMLVAWTAAACVAQGCDLPEERLIAIGNRQGVRVPLERRREGFGGGSGDVAPNVHRDGRNSLEDRFDRLVGEVGPSRRGATHLLMPPCGEERLPRHGGTVEFEGCVHRERDGIGWSRGSDDRVAGEAQGPDVVDPHGFERRPSPR